VIPHEREHCQTATPLTFHLPLEGGGRSSSFRETNSIGRGGQLNGGEKLRCRSPHPARRSAPDPPPPGEGEECTLPISRRAFAPELCFTLQESPSKCPPHNKGGRAPFGASTGNRLRRRRRTASLLRTRRAPSLLSRVSLRDRNGGALALRRSTAVMRRKFAPPTRPGPRFLELPGANGRTLPGASAASTSHSGHAPEGTMPRPPGPKATKPWLREPHPPHQPASPVDVPE
jgi:hypothetical protein